MFVDVCIMWASQLRDYRQETDKKSRVSWAVAGPVR